MNWVRLFFSFRGRVNRAEYWLVSLIWFVLAAVVLDYVWPASDAAEVPIGANHLVDAVLGLVVIPPIASGLAVLVKRLHDRNKSAWWLVPFVFCPPVGTVASIDDLDSALAVVLMILAGAISIWAFVELGFAPGTVGANRYGPDRYVLRDPE